MTARQRFGMRAITLLRKVHIYAGLQSLLAVLLFGLTGICATYQHSSCYKEPAWKTSDRQLRLSGQGLTDRQIVDQVFADLSIPLAPWPQDWAIKREGEKVRFEVRTPRTVTRVEVEAKESTIHLQERPLSLSERVVLLHEITWNRPLSKADFRLFLWSLYIEFSLWSLILFLLSGLVLWASAPRNRKISGLIFFGVGWFCFVVTVGMMR